MDGQTLQQLTGSLRCPQGHSFDLAREGYCNLLLVQQKASASPGDNTEMVMARRRFLESGSYGPLAEKISKTVQEISHGKESFRILDAGCGEGYYLRQLAIDHPWIDLIGVDISKQAVKAASKLSPQISWAVASNKQLPLKDSSIDLILCMFGFPVWNSFHKVQGNGKHVILVDASEDHLLELRNIIYPTVTKSAAPSIQASFQSGYRELSDEKLSFSIKLNSQSQIQDLISMTPHAHRITAEGAKRLSEVNELQVTVDLAIRVLENSSSS